MTSIKSEPFTVGPVTLAFPSLFVPSKPRNSTGTEKYNTGVVVTAEQYAQVIKPQIDALITAAFKKGEAQAPKFNWPFYECIHKSDTYPEAAKRGMLYGNAKSLFEIEVLDGARQPIINPGIIKDGAQVYLSLHLYSFDQGGGTGIGLGLGPVMFDVQGEALNVSGGQRGVDAFAGIEVNTSVPASANVAPPQSAAPAGGPPGAPTQAAAAPAGGPPGAPTQAAAAPAGGPPGAPTQAAAAPAGSPPPPPGA